MRKLVLAALFMLAATQAVAQEFAWNDVPNRLTLGVRGEHSWISAGGEEPVPNVPREFAIGVVGSYYLVPKWSIIAGTTYGLDSKLFRSWLGLNLKVYSPAWAGQR